MAPCRLLQALLLVAAFSSQAAGALLPHGPGVLLQHVGRVTHASLAGRRAYVATASNVVACLTQRTGEIGAYGRLSTLCRLALSPGPQSGDACWTLTTCWTTLCSPPGPR